jgi:hypothetical protein
VTGLIIRVLVLCTVVFAVVYALTRALRTRLQNKEIARVAEQVARVADEVEKLRRAVQAGSVSSTEYAASVMRLRADCERLGLDAPDLPGELPPPPRKD